MIKRIRKISALALLGKYWRKRYAWHHRRDDSMWIEDRQTGRIIEIETIQYPKSWIKEGPNA